MRPLPVGSRWRLLELENTTDDISMTRLVLFERTDGDAPLRVWCQGLVVEEPWTQVAVEIDADELRIDLPTEMFYGMPRSMYVTRPANVVQGSRWTVRGEDRKTVLAPLVLKRAIPQTDADVKRIERFYRRQR